MKKKLDTISFYVFSETFISAIASQLRVLTFPLYALVLGYSPYTISLLFVIYYITHLIFSYPFGLLSQKIGASKVSLISTFTDAVSIFLVALHTLPSFITSFILLGIASATSSQTKSLISYNFKDRLKSVYSRMIALFLAGNLLAEILTAIFGQLDLFAVIYFSIGAVYILFSIISLFLIRRFKDVNVKPKIKYIPSGKLLFISILYFIATFSGAIVATFIQIWFSKENLSVFDVSVIYMVTSIIGIVSSFLTDKISENTLLKFSVYISISALEEVLTFLIYFPPPISVISFVAISLIEPVLVTADNIIISNILDALNEIENGFALLSTFRMLGEIFGTLGEGLLFTLGDYIVPFILGASLGILSLALEWVIYKRVQIK